ncbi:MAG: hybrid sensor histidine kinase/response regulator [Verrucomicrobia bacterium]|nr:hybrid sensor histidine kinase/response regulator [Verrucomicrobiota bacterium]
MNMLATLNPEPGTDAPAPLPAPDSRGTLLIVDDEDGPRQSLKVIFKGDYELLIAHDGATAIDLAQRHPVDVAVLDIRMAGMSGIEVLERLKFVDPNLEVVMMTAFETAETMKQALRLRASDYINKPFDVSTIRAAVARAMDRRTLAGEIRKTMAQLEQLQKDLNRQKLEDQIIRDRGEIYASIIHDINGPLTIISGQIQMINQHIEARRTLLGEDLEIVKDRLKRLTRQVTACIEISRRYLQFLRQSPGDNPRVWINQILGDLEGLLKVHPSTRSNQVLIHPLPEDVTVLANGTDLIQILLNLTLNALQATPEPHRVEISGQLLNHPMDVAQFRESPGEQFMNGDSLKGVAPLLALSVQDNGPGIAPEVLPRIFQPFFTTQPQAQGTGLGLTIVQRLLNEAHGALHVHSQVGRGSVFTVYLQARTATPAPTLI